MSYKSCKLQPVDYDKNKCCGVEFMDFTDLNRITVYVLDMRTLS